MEGSVLHVRMFGDCSITLDQVKIEDSENRSKKVWLLLTYLIHHRHRTVSQKELISLLWGEDNESANPAGALKTMLHRARTLLDQLAPNAGHTLIQRKDNGYIWNPAVSTIVDAEQFDTACRIGVNAQNADARLDELMTALDSYQGDFLSKLSSEHWVVPINAYYHNLYVQTVLEVLPILKNKNLLQEMTDLCSKALKIEPYQEALYQQMMHALIAQGDQKGAVTVYEEMSKLLLSHFGVMPSEETRAIYRQAVRTVNDKMILPSMMREQLRETGSVSGALLCEYDFFKILYQAEARSVSRSGAAVHIGLITLVDENGNELSQRSLAPAMENLGQILCSNLRKGDVASKCSASEYVIMLSHANYENSCMVCDRIVRAFSRRYPHSPAQLHYYVQPLEPT